MPEQNVDLNQNTLMKRSPNQVIHLHNVSCPYCGVMLTSDTTEKEHVIGRRFVPKGKLNGNWNLIVNACQTCNRMKADLEDDISAITMQPDALGHFGHDDPTGMSEAARKANDSYSRRTKRLVKNSHEQSNLTMSSGHGLSIKFSFTGPPQVDQDRIFQLAQAQLMAFFYLITFQKDDKRGYFWPGSFYPIMASSRTDWGNAVLRAFSNYVINWEPCFIASNADGFCKIVIRKHPNNICWSWALEWNHSLRVIGFFGDSGIVLEIMDDLPKLEMQEISDGPNATIRFRTETPLTESDDDKLFYWEDGTD